MLGKVSRPVGRGLPTDALCGGGQETLPNGGVRRQTQDERQMRRLNSAKSLLFALTSSIIACGDRIESRVLRRMKYCGR